MKTLINILEQQLKLLQIIMVAMRSLQRSLIKKELDDCSGLIMQVKRLEQELRILEAERTHAIQTIAIDNGVDFEKMKGEVLIQILPQCDRRPTRLIISQLKEIITHIKFLAQSIHRFSSSVGETMREIFEELLIPNERMYTERGTQKKAEKRAVLHDSTR